MKGGVKYTLDKTAAGKKVLSDHSRKFSGKCVFLPGAMIDDAIV